MPNLTYEEIREREKRYEKIGAPRTLLTQEERLTIYSHIVNNLDDPDVVRLHNAVENKDFREFQKIPAVLACYQGMLELDKHGLLNEDFDLNSPKADELMRENLMNPFFRTAVEMGANAAGQDPAVRERCRRMSDRMDEIVMENTLAPAGEKQINNLASAGYTEPQIRGEINRSSLTGATIAKTLFLSQFASVGIRQDDGLVETYRGSLTSVFSHGTRTSFIFPKGAPGENTIENMVFRNIVTEDDGTVNDKGTTVESRIFASHGMSVSSNASGPADFKETSSWLNPFNWTHNSCINPAIGGIGNLVSRVPAASDGRFGHIYLKSVESTERESGFLMMGFEGEAPGETGMTGHKHDALAKPGKVSPFGALKGAPGRSKGGRLVDLSDLPPEVLGGLMRAFSTKYNELNDKVNDFTKENLTSMAAGKHVEMPDDVADARRKLKAINSKLAGPMMDQAQLAAFLRDDLGIRSISVTRDGSTREVPLDELMQIRSEHIGTKYAAMNANAKAVTPPENDVDARMQQTAYTTSTSFDSLSKALNKLPRKTLFIKRKDSPKMKDVKKALSKVAALSQKKNDGNAYEAKQAYEALITACNMYVNDPKKAHNDRWDLVNRICTMAGEELNVVNRVQADIVQQLNADQSREDQEKKEAQAAKEKDPFTVFTESLKEKEDKKEAEKEKEDEPEEVGLGEGDDPDEDLDLNEEKAPEENKDLEENTDLNTEKAPEENRDLDEKFEPEETMDLDDNMDLDADKDFEEIKDQDKAFLEDGKEVFDTVGELYEYDEHPEVDPNLLSDVPDVETNFLKELGDRALFEEKLSKRQLHPNVIKNANYLYDKAVKARASLEAKAADTSGESRTAPEMTDIVAFGVCMNEIAGKRVNPVSYLLARNDLSKGDAESLVPQPMRAYFEKAHTPDVIRTMTFDTFKLESTCKNAWTETSYRIDDLLVQERNKQKALASQTVEANKELENKSKVNEMTAKDFI